MNTAPELFLPGFHGSNSPSSSRKGASSRKLTPDGTQTSSLARQAATLESQGSQLNLAHISPVLLITLAILGCSPTLCGCDADSLTCKESSRRMKELNQRQCLLWLYGCYCCSYYSGNGYFWETYLWKINKLRTPLL